MNKILIRDSAYLGGEKTIDMFVGDFYLRFSPTNIDKITNNNLLLLFSWLPNIKEMRVFYYENPDVRRIEIFFSEDGSSENRVILTGTGLEYKIHQFIKQIYG